MKYVYFWFVSMTLLILCICEKNDFFQCNIKNINNRINTAKKMNTITPNNDQTDDLINGQFTPASTFVDAKANVIVAPTLKTSGRWEKPEDDRDEPDVENCSLVTKTVWKNWLCSLKDTSQ
jgi:hypothetical protein